MAGTVSTRDRHEAALGGRCPTARRLAPRQAQRLLEGASLLALNLMGVHHGIQRQRCSSRAMQQGQDRRPEGAVQAQGHLGTSHPPPDGEQGARTGSLQPGNRQQAARLRPSQPQGSGHLPRRPGGISRAVVMQHKTQRPVQFEITPATGDAVQKWIKQAGLRSDDFVFPSRIHDSPHLGTRQYARILEGWVEELGLDPADYGTHSMRRTKATLIYRRTKNLRAVQLLLGHSKLESTVRYLGIEVDDALEISEQTEI